MQQVLQLVDEVVQEDEATAGGAGGSGGAVGSAISATVMQVLTLIIHYYILC
jgi:hypothetical protein